MQQKLFYSDPYKSLLPQKVKVSEGDVSINLWEIDQTISQLSYLTHGYFRYYGKFPSTLAAQLLEDFPAPKDDAVLLDCFSGSGTSLLEASRRGIKSVGLDINPLAVLSGKVKTNNYNISLLNNTFQNLKRMQKTPLQLDIEIPDKKFIEKWFFDETVNDLIHLKKIVSSISYDHYQEFFLLAFLSIVRRISKAYDGEVRPHINKKKKVRSPFEAFNKKVKEMIDVQAEFQKLHGNNQPAITLLHNSMNPFENIIPNGNYWLSISHPPYLNCFDYIPVFNLELVWGLGFQSLWHGKSIKEVRDLEVKSWPANSDQSIERYYNQLKAVYENTYAIQPKSGKCAIVVGDCTIKGRLEPVHKKLADIVEGIGYKLFEINYRTTHYSTGKYSYQHRADYHGEVAEKKDAIMIFEKS